MSKSPIGKRRTYPSCALHTDEHLIAGSLFDAWKAKYDVGVVMADEEIAAAALEVLGHWEAAEDRQIPLNPYIQADADKILQTQLALESAQVVVDDLGPAAVAVYAALPAAMSPYLDRIDERLKSEASSLFLIVQSPSYRWHNAVFEAVNAWILSREAVVSQRARAASHFKPEKSYGGKGRQLDVVRLTGVLATRHCLATIESEEVQSVLAAVADVWLDLGSLDLKFHLAEVVGKRFGGHRPAWPADLGASRFDPTVFETALMRATVPAQVSEIVEAVMIAEGLDRAAVNANDAVKAISDSAKQSTGAVTRPMSPVLSDLAGYGAARAWGETLAADLADYRAKRIGWEDVDAGCLLHGPPGTGKTLFASALAATCGVPFIPTSYADWQATLGGHAGDVVKAIQTVFKTASENAPCIVFIDEIDAIPARNSGGRHDEWFTMVTTALLECLDGTKRREGVVVVAACNHPHRLDPALVRSGRLDRRFAIELPDEEALVGILAHHLPGIDVAVLEPVATTLAGTTSGADASRIAREARRIARRAGRDLVADDLLAVAMPRDLRPLDVQRRLAIHEAGHAVALMCQGRMPVSLSLVQSGESGARVMSDTSSGGLHLLGDVEAEVVVCLAGRAAEEVVLGQPSVGAGGGSGSDLEVATRLLATSASILGLGGYLVHGLSADGGIIEERLRRLYAETLLLIGRHRVVVERLADVALEHRVLGRKALATFAEEHLRTGGWL
jgi:hypothetical protein